MTTQSKSVLIPFLIIAGIVFAVALAWKFLATEETEISVKPAEVQTSVTTKPEKAPTQSQAEVVVPKTIVYDEPAFLEPTAEDREVLRDQAKSNMKFSMRYPTLEKSLTALQAFRSTGNDQAAAELISYIRTSFPNDTIPSNLLD